jgi:hypothetical protein
LNQTGLALEFAPEGWAVRCAEIAISHGEMLAYFPSNDQENPEIVEQAVRGSFAALEFARVHIDESKLLEIIRNRTEFVFGEVSGLGSDSEQRLIIDLSSRMILFKKFATITCPNLTVLRGCRLYYEVEILEINAESTVQFGFADHRFRPDDEEGLGVGDDTHSWAVDGISNLTWHNGITESWPEESNDMDSDSAHESGGEQDLEASGDPAVDENRDGEEEDGDDPEADENQDENSLPEGSDADNAEWEDWGDTKYDWSVGDVIGFACDPAAAKICVSVNGVYVQSFTDADGPREAFKNVFFCGPGLYPALTGNDVKIRYNFGPLVGGEPFRFPSPPGTWANMEKWLGHGRQEKAISSSSTV